MIKQWTFSDKKKLFDNCEMGNVVDELVNIIPNIVTRLRKEGMLADFVTFMRLINEDKCPLNNISFLLLLEVSRWYSIQTRTQMFYSEKTMKFWKVLYRMFHGKALRLCPGLNRWGKSSMTHHILETMINKTRTLILQY